MPKGGGFFATGCGNSSKWAGRMTEWYPTAEAAKEVFEGRIQKAITVHRRNQKVDAQGKAIGNRAVAEFRDPRSGEIFTSVFWLDGRNITSVDSTSYFQALFLEWADEWLQ